MASRNSIFDMTFACQIIVIMLKFIYFFLKTVNGTLQNPYFEFSASRLFRYYYRLNYFHLKNIPKKKLFQRMPHANGGAPRLLLTLLLQFIDATPPRKLRRSPKCLFSGFIYLI